MSLWPRNKPLNHPPGYGRGETRPAQPDPVIASVRAILHQARSERSKPMSAKVAR